MASAYTPGLTVSADIIVRRTRRLPIKGEVLVKVGEAVQPETVVARALLPGPLQIIKLADKLGMDAADAIGHFKFKVGDRLRKGDIIAQTKGFMGFGKQELRSEVEGTIESITEASGSVFVREAPLPVEISAYIQGSISDVLSEEGATVETRCSMVQGIFGVGGERSGQIHIAVDDPSEILEPKHVQDSDAGKILIGGAGVSAEALRRAAKVGVIGLVVGGIRDADLTQFLGYDIGVAITGQENIPLTLMVTEGFGYLNMAERTFELLKTLEGRFASLNGATQIRAGVIRPEIIVPLPDGTKMAETSHSSFELGIGAAIRIIREPYFGQLGAVTDLPAQLAVVDSGTHVRVLRAKLQSGEEVTVPRANVEIIAN